MSERRGLMLSRFPWSLSIIAYLVVTYYLKTPLEGVVGYILIGLGIFVLFVEFFKSGDVSSAAFIVDHLFALLALMISTVLMAFLFFVLGEVPNFFYWFGYAVILGDAIFSPFNAYRMALRNFGVGGQ